MFDFFGSLFRYLRDRLTRRVEFVLRNEITQRDKFIADLKHQQADFEQRIAALEPLVSDHHRVAQRVASFEPLLNAHQQVVQRIAALEPLLNAHQQVVLRIAALEPLLNAHQQVVLRIAAFEPLLNAHQQAITLCTDLETVRKGLFNVETVLVEALRQQLPWSYDVAHSVAEFRPLVSIILPTRNRSRLLGGAIRSVLAQKYEKWELLIVDDGSTDCTEEFVRSFLDDRRIRYFRRPALGVSPARNHGLQQAQGDLVAYIDSDNVWFPGFLFGMVAAFLADPTLQSAYGVLLTEHAIHWGSHILWRSFDRAALVRRNFIDLGTFVHRKKLYLQLGGFDEGLERLVDWDLILRYTEKSTPLAVPVLSTFYRTRSTDRITNEVDLGPNWFRVVRKWLRRPEKEQRPRVLYLLHHYPQLSEAYIETEIDALRRLGTEIEIWSESDAHDNHLPSVRVHRGALVDAIKEFKPVVAHAHHVDVALRHESAVAAFGIPTTVRVRGNEATVSAIHELLARPNIQRLYLFPHQATGLNDTRVRSIAAAFDTTLFQPSGPKDRRMVLRTTIVSSSNDLDFFFELAKALPGHHFVLAACTYRQDNSCASGLRALAERFGSPVDLRFDLKRNEVALLTKQAGLYLHTAPPPDAQNDTAVGMPVSIAEAMATGALILVRDLEPLRRYVGEAGMAYRDVDEAVRLIRATADWTEEDWRRAELRSIDRAWLQHADETTLHPILEDWCELARSR